MKGDNSRDTFQRSKHYRNVRMQQGRVQLDADWNELNDVFDDLLSKAVGDILGGGASVGMPAIVLGSPPNTALGVGGIAISLATLNNLQITPGRFYVDGISGELNPPAVGTNYLLTTQPDLPGATLPTADGTYLVYLDVWQRHITAVEDPLIREVALGGPDTATRSQTLAQIKLLSLGPVSSPPASCSATFPAWDQLVNPTNPPQGQLSAFAQAPTAAATPCDIGTGGGFTGIQNQLYRVEIHQGLSGPQQATFKWSRDNGSVLAALSSSANPPSSTNPVILLAAAPPDAEHGFTIGQWVELLDDTIERQGRSGLLVKLTNVDGVNLTFDPNNIRTPGGAPSISSPPGTALVDLTAHAKARRWDQTDANGVTNVLLNTPFPLENGVNVTFTASQAPAFFRAGDYWLIPARTAIGATSGIEWPTVLIGSPPGVATPVAQNPRGIVHHFARLALVDLISGTFTNLRDCRKRLPALSTLSSDDIAFKNTQTLLINPPPAPQTVTAALEALSTRSVSVKVRQAVSSTASFNNATNSSNAPSFSLLNDLTTPMLLTVSLSSIDASGTVPVRVRFYMGGTRPLRTSGTLTDAIVQIQLRMTPLPSPPGPSTIIAFEQEIFSFNGAFFDSRPVHVERLLAGVNGLAIGTYQFDVQWSCHSTGTGGIQVSASTGGSTRELSIIEL